MKRINQGKRHCIGIIFIIGGVISCATVPDLNVSYRLPPKSDELKGKRVIIAFEDMRKAKDLLGAGARKEFKNFSENITFSLARGEEAGFKRGAYDVPSLFKEAFKRRLENLGAEVVPVKEEAEIEMVILLQDFFLDLIDRKWVATMGYEAKLVKDEKFLANQVISGEAERLKVVGRSAADRVMGEIFTDLVNRLDAVRLFNKAGLL